ncbi:MAG TPA: efflux RND transporter permease subunit [Methylothermaceae bacterium]|nr:efflux RND transporter permease subunit [Methylothermaceae bacterium]
MVIERLIGWCARNRLLTFLLAGLAFLWGWQSLRTVPLDAVPDLSDVQVIIYTEWPGRSPDLVEDQISYPLSAALLAAPRVKSVRAQSYMGLSFIYVIFEEGTDLYWARSRVLEYLNTAQGRLPDGVRPALGPDATGVGWVYEYALVDESGRHDLAQLRSLQDFKLRYWLEAVPGVAEVASVGGFVKEYQIHLDPARLVEYGCQGQRNEQGDAGVFSGHPLVGATCRRGIPLQRIVQVVRRANADVGGRVLEIAGHEQVIRGRGYVHGIEDLEKIVVAMGPEGVPVRLGDVAEITLGPAQRRGLVELDGEGETVGGIVVMRYGEDALKVIGRVKARLAEAKKALAEGVEIVTVYDRSDLIERAIATLRTTLVEEMLVVAGVIVVFLGRLRSAGVVVLTLPVAVLLAFIPMNQQQLSANIMSLGGIAVAIGAMVDAAIVIVENVHRRLGEQPGDRLAVMIGAMQEVGPSIFFSLLIITVSFLPVFTLEGTEGRLFKPLAYTKTYAMGFAALLAITLTPALAAGLIQGPVAAERGRLAHLLESLYTAVLRWALKWRVWVLAMSLLVLSATVPLWFQLGSEFMPPLNEGSILYMPTAPPGMSVTEAGRIVHAMDKELKSFPEVARVFGKMGRSTSPTDPAPLSMAEIVVTLKPRNQWRQGMTWDKLIAQMDRQLRYPGMPNVWWMPIQTRTEMLATGIRSSLGIKVFGDDLATVEAAGIQIEKALQSDPHTAPHTRSVFAERLGGGYFLDFDIDRERIARYGLSVGDVEDVIQTAIGGLTVTETVEGRERYAVNLRYARDFRDDPEALKRALVATPAGAQVPLAQLAGLHFRTGAPMLRGEDGQLVGYVFVDVDEDIGIADYVDRAKQVVADKAQLPAGVRLAWAGQFRYFERARAKLMIVAPLTLLIVFIMLYLHRGSVTESLLVLATVPFSLTGAVFLLWLLDYHLSVAVWVGMIALAGLDAEMGLLMLVYLDLAWRRRQGRSTVEAVIEGAARRLRPMLMTGLASFLGLVPILWSTGTGADVMKRIAAPMIGGIASALIVVLVVFPVWFVMWKDNGD